MSIREGTEESVTKASNPRKREKRDESVRVIVSGLVAMIHDVGYGGLCVVSHCRCEACHATGGYARVTKRRAAARPGWTPQAGQLIRRHHSERTVHLGAAVSCYHLCLSIGSNE